MAIRGWRAARYGQFIKLDRSGKVIAAIGNGMGIGPGQFIEASYWVFDKQDNLYAGDTSVGRVTKMVASGEEVEVHDAAVDDLRLPPVGAVYDRAYRGEE